MRSDGKNNNTRREELLENINKDIVDGINQYNSLKNETKLKEKTLEVLRKEKADLEMAAGDVISEEKLALIIREIQTLEEKISDEIIRRDTLEHMFKTRGDDLVIVKEPLEIEKKKVHEIEILINKGTEDLLSDTKTIEKIQVTQSII